MVYALQVDANERLALAAISGGADLDVLSQSRERLDAALSESPADGEGNPEQAELRRALRL